MILLCGIPSEPPVEMVVQAAEELDVEYVLFNQRESHYADIDLSISCGQAAGVISVGDRLWPLDTFSGVYVRLMDYHELPENKPSIARPFEPNLVSKSALFHEGLTEWLEITDCRVMNRLAAMASNASKPYQAQFITKVGFNTPATLITNEPEEVKEFLDIHKRIIYKSSSGVRSIVKELDAAKLNDLEKIRYLPTQFQAFVPGTNIRVHVAGDEVFATEINSEAIDYRYAEKDGVPVSMSPMSLESEIETRCVALSRSLGLPLCGIDLKRTPGGDYYCFEANPSPAYSVYQQHTGQLIAQAIVNYLVFSPDS